MQFTWRKAIMVEINDCTVDYHITKRKLRATQLSRISTAIYFELIAKFHSTS
jgi:hypothetical protein